VQEVACKLVKKRVPFIDAEDLLRFAHHAARCLWIDNMRTSGRRQIVLTADDDDFVSRDDADAVLDRLNAVRAWQTLSVTDRTVLMRTDDAAAEPQEYVRRHRARGRLARALEGLAAWLAWQKRSLHLDEIDPLLAVTALAVAYASLGSGGPAAHIDDRGRAGRGAVTQTATALGRPAPSGGTSDALRGGSGARPALVAGSVTGYQERVSLPTTHADIRVGDTVIHDAGTRPTKEGDAIICVKTPTALGNVCAGEAGKVLPGA
jgi:hypothetical protein